MVIQPILFALLLSLSGLLSAADRSAEVGRYVESLNSSTIGVQRKALERLAWAGLSDARIFDLIEQRLLARYMDSVAKADELDLTAWYAKALPYSGEDKYRSTLIKVAEDASTRKVRKYAQQSLSLLDRYERWNEIINAPEHDDPSRPGEMNRIYKMLISDDAELKRIGGKRLYHQSIRDDYLLVAAQQSLLGMAMKHSLISIEVDAAAWLCKALGQAGGSQQIDALQQVYEQSPHKKIRKYAKKYL